MTRVKMITQVKYLSVELVNIMMLLDDSILMLHSTGLKESVLTSSPVEQWNSSTMDKGQTTN